MKVYIPVFRTLLACFTAALISSAPSHAQCTGTDLLAQLPAETRSALRAAAHAQPYPDGILWQARKDDRVIHLVGTMHFADPRHTATMDRIRPLIDRAATVFLELGDGDEARLNAHLAANPGLAFIVEGPTLPDLLSPEDWATLKDAMADRGMPGFMVAKMQPWFAMMNLGLSKCIVQQIAAGKKGIDQTITDYAASVGKPARALEPFDTAFGLFTSYSDEESLEFLRLSLAAELADPDDQHETLTTAYFREEIRIMWEYSVHQALAHPDYPEEQVRSDMARIEKILIEDRNRAWVDRILPATDTGEVLVAAGALHLPGDAGLLRLLEQEGFTLTRLPR